MKNTTYQATIYFDSVEDSFTEGAIGKESNSWTEDLKAETLPNLKALILEATHCETDDGLFLDNCNDYPYASEYWTNFQADLNNFYLDPAIPNHKKHLDAWEMSKARVWSVSCHILVSRVIKERCTL